MYSEGMRNLVSWLPSINDVIEGSVSGWKGNPNAEQTSKGGVEIER